MILKAFRGESITGLIFKIITEEPPAMHDVDPLIPEPVVRIVQKALSPARQEKVRAHYQKHAFWTVVVGRHTPLLRAPVFFLAGASRVPLWEFLLADALSAAITVPLVVTLGFYFGEHLDDIRSILHRAQWALAAVVLAGLTAWYLWRRHRRNVQ